MLVRVIWSEPRKEKSRKGTREKRKNKKRQPDRIGYCIRPVNPGPSRIQISSSGTSVTDSFVVSGWGRLYIKHKHQPHESENKEVQYCIDNGGFHKLLLFRLKGHEQAHHHEGNDENERVGTEGDDGPHGIDAVGDDHHQSQRTQDYPPDHLEAGGRVLVASGGEHGQDKGGAHHAGNDKKKRRNNCGHNSELMQGKGFQQGKGGGVDVCRCNSMVIVAEIRLIGTQPPHHAEPQGGKPRGYQQHPEDILTDSPPFGNSCQKHPHEGCPSQPPDHVIECPVGEPLPDAVPPESENKETLWNDTADVLSEGLGDGTHEKGRGTEQQKEHDEPDGHRHSEVGEHSHPLPQIPQQRENIGGHQAGKDAQRQCHASILNAQQPRKPALYLEYPHGNGARQADGDGIQSHNIHPPTGHPGNRPPAEHRVNGCGYGLRASQAKTKIGDHQPPDTIDGPRMKPPVEYGQGKSLPHGNIGFGGLTDEFVVEEGFGNAVEQEAHAHTGGKHHVQPGERGELRTVVVTAQSNAPVPRKRQPEAGEKQKAHGQHYEPASAFQQDGNGVIGEHGKAGSVHHPPDDNHGGHPHCGHENRISKHVDSPINDPRTGISF